MSDIINNVLDLAPTSTEIIVPDRPDTGNQIEDDFEYARDNIYDIITITKDSVIELMEVARSSQHPKAYEALTEMLKTMVDINKDLISLQKTKKEILVSEASNNSSAEKTVNNNLFVGSTADLSKFLEEMKAK